MKLYYLDKRYLEYLSKFDSKVMKKNDRPYIGIVLKRNNNHYFAPLSSPKPKHERLYSLPIKKRPIGLYFIDKCNLGVVQLNNMVPVKKGNIKLMDFSKEDEKQKVLLRKQVTSIDKEQLLKMSERTMDMYNKRVPKAVSVCCDFNKLEEKCKEYSNKDKIINKNDDIEF